jgi:hypothetical protein
MSRYVQHNYSPSNVLCLLCLNILIYPWPIPILHLLLLDIYRILSLSLPLIRHRPHHHRPILIPKIRRLGHMTEQPHLHHARQHLDPLQQRIRLLHHVGGEGGVDDEVAVVGDDGAGFVDCHAQGRRWGAEGV